MHSNYISRGLSFQVPRFLAWICFGISLIVAACASNPNQAEKNILGITSSISTRADYIDETIEPFPSQYDPQKTAIFKQTYEIRKSAADINQAVEEMKEWGLSEQHKKERYENDRLVMFIVHLETLTKWLAIGALAFCALGFFSGFNPFSVLNRIAQFIAELIPFGQIVTWPRKIVLWWRNLKIVQTVVDKAVPVSDPTPAVPLGTDPNAVAEIPASTTIPPNPNQQ